MSCLSLASSPNNYESSQTDETRNVTCDLVICDDVSGASTHLHTYRVECRSRYQVEYLYRNIDTTFFYRRFSKCNRGILFFQSISIMFLRRRVPAETCTENKHIYARGTVTMSAEHRKICCLRDECFPS